MEKENGIVIGHNWLNKIYPVLSSHQINFQGNIKYILNNRSELLLKYENNLMLKDWLKFISNRNLVIAKETLLKKIDNKYFKLDLSLNVKRMIAQVKLAVINYGSIFEGKHLKFRSNIDRATYGLPNSCNLKHILLDCRNFKNGKEQLFGAENKDWYE